MTRKVRNPDGTAVWFGEVTRTPKGRWHARVTRQSPHRETEYETVFSRRARSHAVAWAHRKLDKIELKIEKHKPRVWVEM